MIQKLEYKIKNTLSCTLLTDEFLSTFTLGKSALVNKRLTIKKSTKTGGEKCKF